VRKIVRFKNELDRYNKLHPLGLIYPTYPKLYYIDSEERHECEVIRYTRHKTQPGCINEYYETLVIHVGDRIININPDYLKSMQRKDFKLWFQKGKHGHK
jgi:hypothetical protein